MGQILQKYRSDNSALVPSSVTTTLPFDVHFPSSLSVYFHIYSFMCTHTYIHTFIYIHIHIHFHSHTYFSLNGTQFYPFLWAWLFCLKNTIKVLSTSQDFLRRQKVSLACLCWCHQAHGLWSRAHQSFLKVPTGSVDRPNTRPPPHPCQGQITGSRWVFCWKLPISISAVGSSTKPCLLTHGWQGLRETVIRERGQLTRGKGWALSGKNYQMGFTTFIKSEQRSEKNTLTLLAFSKLRW